MDLNSLIVDLATNFDPSYINLFKTPLDKKKVFAVSQTNFRTIQSLDQHSKHIPEKYKVLRIQHLNEYLLNNGIVKKGQFVYAFRPYLTDSLVLNLFTINDVTKDQLTTISAIFNTPDIKSVMTYQIDVPNKNISWINFNEILNAANTSNETYTITFGFNENMYREYTQTKAKPEFSKIVRL